MTKNLFELSNLKVRSRKYDLVYDKDCKAYRQKHQIEISNAEGKKKYFTYTTQILNFIPTKEKMLENALYCVYSDFLEYEYQCNENTFIDEFGYEEKEGKRIWNLIEKSHNRFNELLDKNTLSDLEEHYENY